MPPLITMLLILDVEKDERFTDYFFDSLTKLNADGLDDLRLLINSQQAVSSYAMQAAATAGFPVDIVHARHPMIDGYPVWDVCASVRAVLPIIDTPYLTFAHPEYFLCAGRLKKTAEYLRRENPYLALGNLRRFGTKADSDAWEYHRGTKSFSDALIVALGKWRAEEAARIAEESPSLQWVYWRAEEPAGESRWLEDIFFARVDWLRAVRFFDHCPDKPFQDVYDLMGEMFARLAKYKLEPRVLRLPRDVHQAMHLWHPKQWMSFSPAMRAWFESDPKRWKETTFGRPDIWDALLAGVGQSKAFTERPVVNLRNAPGGTVTRFAAAVSEWLQNGGKEQMEDFYQFHGRDRFRA